MKYKNRVFLTSIEAARVQAFAQYEKYLETVLKP